MDSATESGARVTRALRKRLTSIDSDNGSSRPGTPVQSKLAAATTNSPLKQRMTRRNSTSGVGTPIKTPGKRAANAVAAISETEEPTVTSARRVTRRSSISQTENESTPKPDIKAPNFESLEEEQVTIRVTRSKSKSPEQAKVNARIQRGPKSMVRKDSVNLSYTKADSNVETVKDETDCEASVFSNKKDDIEDSSSSPTKDKPSFTDNDKDKKILNNKKDELELNSSTQKRKSILTDVNNDKKKLNELSLSPKSFSNRVSTTTKTAEKNDNEDNTIASPQKRKSLSTSVNTTSKTPERKDVEDKTIASPQERKPLLISATAAVEKPMREDNKSNNIDDKSKTSPQKQKSLSNSVNTRMRYAKSPERDEVAHVKTYQVKDAEDKPNTSLQDRTFLSISVATAGRVPPEENKVVILSNIKMNEEDKPNSPLRRQFLLNSKSPTTDNGPKTPKCHDEHGTLKSEKNITTHGEAQSPSVVLLKEDPDEILVGNMTKNVAVSAENKNAKFLTTESSQAPSSNCVDDSHKEADIMEVDVISIIPNEPVKTVCITLSPPSETKHDLNVEAITPARNASRKNTYSSADGNSLKTVAFSSNISEDECEKSIYPKTPVSAKSKSFIEIHGSRNDDHSFQGDCCSNDDSVVIIQDTTDVEIPETQQEEITSPKSANKTIVDDDTIVSIVESNNATTEVVKIACLSQTEMGDDKAIAKELPRDDDTKSSEECVVQDSISCNSPDIKLRWYNPCVVAKGSKLDTITKNVESGDKSAFDDDKFVKQKKKRTFLKRSEWNDDDESSYDEEDVEDGEEENKIARKNPFHDDEVMVVDDYESGDSMDSKERREILENEIAVDGESIGSHTTDGEDNDEEESENDSFIVSDNCDEEDIADFSRSECDDEVEESNDVECTDRENKKKYKRINRLPETSSSDEDEPSMENLAEVKDVSENRDSDKHDKLEVNKYLNSSRLSESALRLQSDPEDKSDNSNIEDAVNMSRKEILRTLNQSDRFNKSVRDLHPEVDESPDALATAKTTNISVTSANVNGTKNTKSGEEEEPSSTSGNVSESDFNETKNENVKTSLSGKDSESHLGEVSVTSEEENDNDNGGNGRDSDEEKENAVVKQMPRANHLRGLSVSFGNFKQQETENSSQNKVLQRSFTINVSVNGGSLETEVLQNKLAESKVLSSTSPPASLSSNDGTDSDELSSDFLENIKIMPLGNPLVRTRRQSLALPTNPDMEIGSAQHSGPAHYTKNHKRKSLAVLSGNEFNPSQSFVHSLELRKAELERQTSKRKRLSKSFSGTTADNSVIDVDVRHLHKRSKISAQNSFINSFENTKPDNSMCLKVGHSSTPHEKSSAKKHNNSGIRRILSRCDEILEAANRAKLETKLNYRKSKIRLPKKNKKRMQRQPSSPETKTDKTFAPKTKAIKKRAKIAVTQALKASAAIIIGKQRKHPIEVGSVVSNRLPSDVFKSNADSQSTANKNKKEHPTEQNAKYRNYSTSAGNVVEMLQSPEKKKKVKIIRLPTGNVCVEPVTPTKRSILTCNGMEFHESPITPCPVGFKVLEVLSSNDNNCPTKYRKRKRNDNGRKHTYPTPQWTQSGLFIEEEISSAQVPHSSYHGRISKKTHLGQHQANSSNFNFKQSALHRGDIKRCTAREILQLRERRQMNDHY